MGIEHIKKSIRNIPNFPKPGIQFKDITTLLQNNDAFGAVNVVVAKDALCGAGCQAILERRVL